MATFTNVTKTAINPFNTSKGIGAEWADTVATWADAFYGWADVVAISNNVKHSITPSNQIKN